ncbi:kinase-like domain-containing protein [Lanmaoa asiatica]|nr:kinase-like domain-containing protein [Lanmaoa asiatica]
MKDAQVAFLVLDPLKMLGPSTLLHIPCERCKLKPHKPCTIRQNWELYLLHKPTREPPYWCPAVRGVGTGEKIISRCREAFLRHLLQGHAPTTVPERCARRVKDLTDRIVRTFVYPMAYGGFSDVWSCQLRYKRSPPKRRTTLNTGVLQVAVKAIRAVIVAEEEYPVKLKAVQQELSVWVGLRHRNVLPLYGITSGFGPFPAFVCPWADNGTLSEYLEKPETQLDLKRRMKLLGDIAAGLKYYVVHSRNIVHGDLSGSNILITNSGRACLSDFGLSTLFEQVSDTVASGICFPGNIRWAAPELCGEDRPSSQLSSQQADIYSFGCIMLQTLSGKLPFHGIQRVAQIVIMISCGSKPPRELGWDGRDIPEVLWDFVEACWAIPSKRPSSKDIVSFIRSQL